MAKARAAAIVELPEKPWAEPASEVLVALDSTRDGLSEAECRRRRSRYGKNRLREARARSVWLILVAQFRGVLTALLAAAMVASFVFNRLVEGVAVGAVILMNAGIGFAMELRATRSMEALRKLGQVNATVRREGELHQIPAPELVPGDIVVFEAGDVVTADLRVVESSKLEADESMLTGESLPVAKSNSASDQQAPLAERPSMLFKGTSLTRGAGEAVVVATGMNTELGRISQLVEEAEDETTPLEQRLNSLGKRLLWLTLLIALLVAGFGIAAGHDVVLIVETSIALAVATVPEGLPIVATLALARGMWRMARSNAVAKRLSAVETLGATSVILTDKTGTLTENRLAVAELVVGLRWVSVGGAGLERTGDFTHDGRPPDPETLAVLRRALTLGVLCNNADLPSDPAEPPVGEPLEVALLIAGAKAGLSAESLLTAQPERREETFDPDTKMMATFHDAAAGFLVAVKGAPEAVLSACSAHCTVAGNEPLDSSAKQAWLSHNEQLARRGYRIIAVAEKLAQHMDADPYDELTLIGLVAMADPPRSEVRQVIHDCGRAGIRLVMLTGDQAPTAVRVARSVGLVPQGQEPVVLSGVTEGTSPEALLDTTVFARSTPKQKLDVITLHQGAGAIVAMLGDGVNDAPALRKSDIGVAMGGRGTQVAREAADLVLQDDALKTIVLAVREGRVIFDNIRKFAVYLLSCNVSELLAVGIAALVGLPLPLLPLQILFLNLVTDVFPALALGACEGEKAVMQRSPRPAKEDLLERSHWLSIGGHGLAITAAVLASLLYGLELKGWDESTAVTVSFATLGLAQLWHVFNMRQPRAKVVRNEVTRNAWVWGSIALCVLLILAAVYLPPLARVLETSALGADAWLVVLLFSLAPLVLGQVWLELRKRLSSGQ